MPVAIPSMGEAIAYGIALLLGIVGLVFFRSYITPWIQKWQTAQDEKRAEELKVLTQKQNAEANAESDRLKDIEGR